MEIQLPTRENPLRDALRKKAEAHLADCTACGKCYDACPMTRYAPDLAGAEASAVVGGVLGLLRGEPADAAALAWTAVCVKSAHCVPACPESLDPLMMLRMARIAAYGGFGAAPQATKRDDPLYFARAKAFGRLLLTEEENDAWTR